MRRIELSDEDVWKGRKSHVGSQDVGDSAGYGEPVTVLDELNIVVVRVGAESQEEERHSQKVGE